MAKPTSSLYVRPGDSLSAEKWNGIAAAATKDIKYPYGMAGGILRIPKPGHTPGYIQPINRDVPAFSILVPIGGVSLTKAYRDDYVVQEVDYYTDTAIEATLAGIYYTNGGEPLVKDIISEAIPIEEYKPYLIAYTGTAPAYGDELDVDNTKFTLTKTTGGEFKAVSAANTDLNLVWVVRVSAGASNSCIGKSPTLDITSGSIGTITLYEQLGTSSPTIISPSMTTQGINITGKTLIKNTFIRVIPQKFFNYPILEPAELEAC